MSYTIFENMTTPKVSSTLNASVSKVLDLENVYVRTYDKSELKRMVFTPDYSSEGDDGQELKFSDYVSSLHSYGHGNFDCGTVNPRYRVITPLVHGGEQVRPVTMVVHNTDHQEHGLHYVNQPPNKAIDSDAIKNLATAWRGFYGLKGSVADASMDDLLGPVFERAFVCYWSLLHSTPGAPVQLDPLEWRNYATFNGSGGLLRVGPTNADALIDVALANRIPIFLPSNMMVDTVSHALTLLAVGARAHFYAIGNGGNPWSNYCYESPGSITYMSTQDIPANLPGLTTATAMLALRQLPVLANYLGISEEVFQAAASKAMRAVWIVPDLFTLHGVIGNDTFSSGYEYYESMLDHTADLLDRLRFLQPATNQNTVNWLIDSLSEVENGNSRAIDVFFRCDPAALAVLRTLSVVPDPHLMAVATADTLHGIAFENWAKLDPAQRGAEPVMRRVDRRPEVVVAWSGDVARSMLAQRYERPITLFGLYDNRNKYDFYTYLYTTHIGMLATQNVAVKTTKVTAGWLAGYTVPFLCAHTVFQACMENVALNLVPVTIAGTRGPPIGVLDPVLDTVITDYGSIRRQGASTSAFENMMGAYQLAYTGVSVVPAMANPQWRHLPQNYPRKFSEALITFVDPSLVLGIFGLWTPQLPVSLVGLRRAIPIIKRPTLAGITFSINGPADVHTMLYRIGHTYHASPEITSALTVDLEGFDEVITRVNLYNADYMAELRVSTELIWRLVPAVVFDKLAMPTQNYMPIADNIIYTASEVLYVPEMTYDGTHVISSVVPTITTGVSNYAKNLFAALIKHITVRDTVQKPVSAMTGEGMDKLGQQGTTMDSDTGTKLNEPELASILKGGTASISPSDSASQSANNTGGGKGAGRPVKAGEPAHFQ